LIVLNALLAILIPFIDWRAHLGGLVAGFVAGWIVEGVGPRNARPVVRVVGLLALVALGVALVAWRTDQIRQVLGAV
jgi:hypothetical protein